MLGWRSQVSVPPHGFSHWRCESHHLYKTHSDARTKNKSFSCFYRFQNSWAFIFLYDTGQFRRICFLFVLIQFRHCLCPKMIAETANLLLKFTESTFDFKAVGISFNDENWIQWKISTDQNSTAFCIFYQDKTKFFVQFCAPKEIEA